MAISLQHFIFTVSTKTGKVETTEREIGLSKIQGFKKIQMVVEKGLSGRGLPSCTVR
jgi:hypothetical protein